ncbi:spore germination protein GerPE [Paenibacillus mesophilus]|uniref:spore germination protein GerPE n=1 Tax=Paenibacillus mesophilus TaxID=2582849 RepID=UPI0013053585|nr:spore germination protein GerPE [Paenibacillus mesophilus]
MPRTSAVKNAYVYSVGYSSIFFVGDCVEVKPRTKALAIQRQIANFNANEGSFEAFPIFSRPIPRPEPTDDVQFTVANRSSFIHVDSISIISISTSAVLQIGSNQLIDAESRTKHIRQLQHRPASPS